MPLKYRLSLIFFFTFFVLVFSVDAAHGHSPAHARRSLAFKKKLRRQSGLDIPGALGDLLHGGPTSTSDPSSTSTTSSGATSPSTTDPLTLPTITDLSLLDTPSTSPPPPTSDPLTSPLPTTDTPTSTTSTSPGSPSSSPPASPDTCPLGLDLQGDCILPPPTSPAASSTPVPPVTTSTTPSASSPTSPPTSPPSQTTPTPTPTPDCPLGLGLDGQCVLPPSASPSTPPVSPSDSPSTSGLLPPISLPSTTPILGQPSSSSSPTTPNPGPPSSPTPTSSSPVDPCGSVGQLLGLCPSKSSPPASASAPQTSPTNPSLLPFPSAPPPTSSPVQPVDPCGSLGIALGLCTSPVVPSPTTTPQSPSQSPDPCGSLGIALGLCPSPSPPGSPSGSPSQSASPTITPPVPCAPYQQALGLCSPTTTLNSGTPISSGNLPSSTSSQLTTSFPSGVPTTSGGTVSTTGSVNRTSSSLPVISFPSGTNNTVSPTTSLPPTATSDTTSRPFTPPPQTQLSYITQTSLLGASVPSSSPATLSDPDAVPTTLANVAPSNLPSTTSPILLPSNLPARIYPPTQVDPNSLSGFSLVSILFDQFLPWAFVAQNTQSQGQLFLWFPTIIQSALGLPSEQVKTFALQVYVPAAYSGPADVDVLLTTFLLYIPSDQVPVLANQIKVVSSPLYTSLGDPYKSLASHVNPAFAVNSVQDPNVVPGSTSSANSSGNKSRTDAIIGVASALGGLALVVLGVLIYRSVKRSHDLRHRRLSDPNAPNEPYPDRTGRDFDQDSVGGQRRRSFYFAEDSLRGQQAVQQTAVPVAQGQHVEQPMSQVEYSYRTSPDGVRERRAPVVTGAISAPILTQSSLNW